MILTDKFVWFHFGKTAGDFTRNVFETYIPEQITDSIGTLNKNKHIRPVDFYVKNKNLSDLPAIINFRKLSTWICSYNRHHLIHVLNKSEEIQYDLVDFCAKQTKNGLVIQNPSKICNMDIRDWGSADIFMDAVYLTHKFQFIRFENIQKDLEKLIEKYFQKKIHINKNKINQNIVVPTISLTKNDIAKIYDNNPKWSKLEKEVYNE